MDAIRRGAMLKAGRMALGAIGAAGLAGRGNFSSNPVAPSQYPMTASGAIGEYAAQGKARDVAPDPAHMARRRQINQLEDQMYREVNPRWRLTDNMHTDNSSYLPALKSTAPWWRAHVQQENMKKKARAMETFQLQIQKLMESPMDKLKDMADEALAAFMAELNKP